MNQRRWQGTEPVKGTRDIYHAGLRKTQFTPKCEISNESQLIPIFRVLGYDGTLHPDWELPFSKEEMADMYRFMIRLSVYDDMLYNIQRQGRISFYIQNQGEEALQTGFGAALEKDDNLWCQYRELGVLMWRGFTITDALNQCFSTEGDPSKGRQMPISYTKREIGLHTICTPLTTQLPHAAGCGYAFKMAGRPHVSVGFFGEGAASEGDFHAAMNFACVMKSQTLFVCRNNGYAISTPVRDQYCGDGIAIRGLAYGMQTIRVDGNDLVATYIASKRARELCVTQSEPVCLEFMTYRMGHHSTSDDSSQYRPPGEMEKWTQPGVNAIARVRLFLEKNGLWSSDMEESCRAEAKKTMIEEMKAAEKRMRVAIMPGMFDDIYDTMPWNIREQKESLKKHLSAFSDKYDVSKFREE